jgi:hypothetical protein
MSRYYSPRVSDTLAAFNIYTALKAHPEGGSFYQLERWTGMSPSQIAKGKRRLRLLDERGIFICLPKGADTIYILSEDTGKSRLYMIWMGRRAYRYEQSLLNSMIQTERTATRVDGASGRGGFYAAEASMMGTLAALRAMLRAWGTEAGFSPKEIESWFTEDARWELDERQPA